MTALERRIDDGRTIWKTEMNDRFDRIDERFDQIIALLRQLIRQRGLEESPETAPVRAPTTAATILSADGPTPAKLETDGGLEAVKSHIVAAPNSWVEKTLEEIQGTDLFKAEIDDGLNDGRSGVSGAPILSAVDPMPANSETVCELKEICPIYGRPAADVAPSPGFNKGNPAQKFLATFDNGWELVGTTTRKNRRGHIWVLANSVSDATNNSLPIFQNSSNKNGKHVDRIGKSSLMRHSPSKRLIEMGFVFDKSRVITGFGGQPVVDMGHGVKHEYANHSEGGQELMDSGNYIFDRGKSVDVFGSMKINSGPNFQISALRTRPF